MGKKLTYHIGLVTKATDQVKKNWAELVKLNDMMTEMGKIFWKKRKDYYTQSDIEKKSGIAKELRAIVAKMRQHQKQRDAAWNKTSIWIDNHWKGIRLLQQHVNKRNNRDEGWISKRHTKDAEKLLITARADQSIFSRKASELKKVRVL